MMKYGMTKITKRANKNGIYEEFNNFNHKEKPITDFDTQRKLYRLVSKNTPEIGGITKLILLKIIEETVFWGKYYTFISQEQIALDLGISERTVVRSMKKLLDLEWISIVRSSRKRRCNCTDFNVEKAMALGKKFKRDCHVEQPSKCQNVTLGDPLKETSKDSSKEESIENEISFSAPKRKLKRNITSVYRTWREACAKLPLEQQPKIAPGCNDRNKFKRFFHKRKTDDGCTETVDKWRDSTEKLHEFITWTVAHWEYLRYRMKWAKAMPTYPHVGWFIANVEDIYQYWIENTDNVVQLKDYEESEIWTNHKGEKFEYFE